MPASKHLRLIGSMDVGWVEQRDTQHSEGEAMGIALLNPSYGRAARVVGWEERSDTQRRRGQELRWISLRSTHLQAACTFFLFESAPELNQRLL